MTTEGEEAVGEEEMMVGRDRENGSTQEISLRIRGEGHLEMLIIGVRVNRDRGQGVKNSRPRHRFVLAGGRSRHPRHSRGRPQQCPSTTGSLTESCVKEQNTMCCDPPRLEDLRQCTNVMRLL
jgi:hypothetical protein